MAKKKKNNGRVTRIKSVTKTKESSKQQLVVQELNIMSADRHYKDIGEFKTALQAAESVHYPNSTRLDDLYDDILLDGHLSGIIAKRIDAILNKKIYYQTSGKKRVDAFEEVIDGEAFRDMVTRIMEVKLHGRSGMEFIPGPELAFKDIPRKHIKLHKKVISFEQSGEEGINYEGLSNIWIIGKEKDLGLLLKCSMYAIWKRGVMADWAQYIEIFGQPVRIIYYDAYDTKTKEELRTVLDESGSSLAMMIPKQALFEMKDGKQSNGNGELQEKFRAVCNDEMSIVILGNTETTSSSKSSGYAQSKEHGKQQLEITKSDLKYVLNFLNSKKCQDILRSYGLPVSEGGKFAFEKELDLEALKTRSEIDINVIALGTPLSDDYVYDTYGIPKPDNYDELKAKQEEQRVALSKERDPANPDPKGKDKKKKKELDKKTLNKNLKADKFLFKFRAFLADFFDPAP
jgi:hypothetical protein